MSLKWVWKALLLGLVIGAESGASAAGEETVASATIAPPAEDDVSIRNLQTNQSTAWNEHDAAAYARLFAEDGEVVTMLGRWWKGRRQIEAKLSSAFDAPYRDSVLTVTDISVRLLSSSVAVAHVRWTMTGTRMPAGIPEPKQGIQTQVLQKRAGMWLIQSLQNTASYTEPASRRGGGRRS